MTDERVSLAEAMPMGSGMSPDLMMGMGAAPPAGNVPAPSDGSTAVSTFGSIITAQRVAVERDESRVLQRLKTLCAMNAHRYIYSWAVKDKRNRREVTISGGTIKMANDLARSYGNCVVDIRAFDHRDHWLFYARFVDLETGYSLTRPFQQRKSQDMGTGMDAERRRDMTFQIGASKAIRNVVLNALDAYAEFMKEECENKLLSWIENNADKANAWISQMLQKHEINLPRIEAVVGRPRAKWTVRDVARVMTELRGVEDGMQSAEDLYPSDQDAAAVTAEKEKAKAEAAAAAEPEKPKPEKRKPTAKKAAAKKAPAKKPEPKPEPEPEPEPEESDDDGEPEPAEESAEEDGGEEDDEIDGIGELKFE